MIELLLNAENALALGLLDSAERTYRTVLEADPRNGIAAVGLSRVALERGDEAGAVALAQAALEIDSENATARRMIDRLEEVARFRADAAGVPAPGDAPPVDDSEAMIRASGNVGGEADDRSAAPTAIGGPDTAIGGPDSARPTHAEIAAGTVERAPANSPAAVGAARIGSEQESSTQRQRPDAGAYPPGIQPAAEDRPAAPAAAAAPAAVEPAAAPAAAPNPTQAPNHPLPARPGLLWRILRRS
jgi:tetratricopeptide (TPR) repeat protein